MLPLRFMVTDGRGMWHIRMRTHMHTAKLNRYVPDPSLKIARSARVRTDLAINGFLTLEKPGCVSDYAGTESQAATALRNWMLSIFFASWSRIV